MARILVVDDSMFQRLTMTDILQRLGHETAEVETGNSALETLLDERFDLICCDLLMPDGTGEDVLAGLRERGDATPVVIVSANVQRAVRDRIEDLGARAFLNKPVDETDLASTTSEILGLSTPV